MRIARMVAATAVAVSMPSLAGAQGEAPPPTPTARVAEADEVPEPGTDNDSTSGVVVLVLFAPSGAAAAGVTVVADTGLTGVSSAAGIVRMTLPAGEHEIRLHLPPPSEGPPPQAAPTLTRVLVTAGVTTEIIGNIRDTGEVAFDVEGPAISQEEVAPEPSKAVVLGRIEGVVVASETQEPLASAKVFVRGVDVEAVTGADGKFALSVPVGVHGISAIRDKYSTQTVNDIDVTAETATVVTLEMSPASAQLDDYVVTAPYIEGSVSAVVTERREASAVAEVIGAEQMAQSGDSSAASALKRVTGLSVVGGKFVYVRGMGERYSSTLLNGLNLPSPEPERRVVPMDLFPAGMLQSVTVQKTYSADMPGEFGGGSVQLRTKSFPDKFTLSLSLSTGGNSESTFQDGLTYRGGKRDWIGLDDGSRSLPEELANSGLIKKETRFEEGLTPAELEMLGGSFEPNYGIYDRTVPVDHGASVTVGSTFDVGFPLGLMASLSYDRVFRLKNKTLRTTGINTKTDELFILNDYSVEQAVTEVNTGALLVVGVEPLPHQRVESTSILLRMTDDKTLSAAGRNDTLGRPVRNYQLRWVERQLFSQQLIGTHPFTLDPKQDEFDLEPLLTWRYAFSNAGRLEPDRRTYRYDFEPALSQYRFANDTGNIERFFSDLEDNMHEGGLDFAWPLSLAKEAKLVPHIGGLALYRDRDVHARNFGFEPGGGERTTNALRQQAPDDVLSRDNIGPDGFSLNENTLAEPAGRGTDTYRAEQSVLAAYGQGNLTLFDDLELMGGARLEKLVQTTTSYNQFAVPEDPQEGDEVDARIADLDILPAVTGTWRFIDGMQLRAGFGVTVSRPDFREKSTSRFFNVEDNIVLKGNPELRSALIRNYDARWEWYPTPDESLSVGAFYKDFSRPIELVGIAAAGTELSWVNSKSATNFGLEFEARKRLGFVLDALSDFYISTNVALIRSSITIDPEAKVGDVILVATTTERALQGQSPYVVNVQVGYDDVVDNVGTNAALLYNVFGPRIDQVGSLGVPDVIEEPHHQLDFVFGAQLSSHWSFRFQAKNLINARKRKTLTTAAESIIQEAAVEGRDFSLSANWRY